MPSAAILRHQIEAALASRIPSALTPASRILRPVAPTGVPELDTLLDGGLPLGALTEMAGPECSGRTSAALSFIAQMTQAAKVCAWVDVSNALDPESAAAAGIDLSRLLWVRCGVQKEIVPPKAAHNGFVLPEKYFVPPVPKKGLHGGGFGPHPRNEGKGLSNAVSGLLQSQALASRCAEPQRRVRNEKELFDPQPNLHHDPQPNLYQSDKKQSRKPVSSAKPWSRIEQALRVTDLLLQAGGFSAIVLDMAGIAPEHASRVPLATWFRYRAAAERTQASVLLLTQHPCVKSSGELLLQFAAASACNDHATLFTGIEHRVEVARRRFTQVPNNVVPLRKPPQSANIASWRSRTAWAGPR